ncbi:MAG: tyrosine recombinase XerD [Ilumatobacteraceae bacterium]|nr:tyrosine recombinase XerD [Ilumatobacteraceae bacterium]
MSDIRLLDLCERIRPELACLGDLGRQLLDVVGVIERVGASRSIAALDEPSFALDVLTAGGIHDTRSIGQLLDFLRLRADSGPTGTTKTSTAAVTVAEAVDLYEGSALALMATGTRATYRTWTRRLVIEHGDRTPRSLTAGDLTDLIARHVIASRSADDRRRAGRSAEENAVGAYRHLWTYLCDKSYATINIALSLRKPIRPEPRRRAFTVEEAALLRQLARDGRDSLLDEVTLAIPERVGLRRIELGRLRVNDIDLERRTIEVWGKGDKDRTMPIPPNLLDLLRRYLESRRPRHLSSQEWLRSDEVLLRRPPSPGAPMGRPTSRRRIEDLFVRLQGDAPDLFARGDLSLHSYRHSLGTFIDGAYGRPMTRAVLGHTSRQSPTDHYVHVATERLADALADYERHLLDPE